MKSVAEWLGHLGLSKYTERFLAADIELDVVGELTDRDLESLGVTLGDRKRLQRAIASLKPDPTRLEARADTSASGPPGTVAPGESMLEYRQISVLFCDLVGSTELSKQLDPEDLHSVLTEYRNCCGSVVERFGGSISNFQGDGVLIRFGY